MAPLDARLKAALIAAGVTPVSVSIGDVGNKATWKVQPASLQSAAQPIIDAFDNTDPATIAADLAAAEAATVGQKDVIAMLGVVASQTDANWNSYTLAQKVAKVQALMTAWKTIRTFVENNF